MPEKIKNIEIEKLSMQEFGIRTRLKDDYIKGTLIIKNSEFDEFLDFVRYKDSKYVGIHNFDSMPHLNSVIQGVLKHFFNNIDKYKKIHNRGTLNCFVIEYNGAFYEVDNLFCTMKEHEKEIINIENYKNNKLKIEGLGTFSFFSNSNNPNQGGTILELMFKFEDVNNEIYTFSFNNYTFFIPIEFNTKNNPDNFSEVSKIMLSYVEGYFERETLFNFL